MTVFYVVGLAFLIHGAGVVAVGKLSGYVPALWRTLCAAALGAAYAALCVVDAGFGAFYWRLGSLLVIGFFAFGRDIKRCVFYLLLILAVESLAGWGGEAGGWIAALAIVGLLLLLRTITPDKAFVPVVLRLGSKQVKLKALRDTGNTLRDPISGSPVLILDGKTSRELTGLSSLQLRSPVEVMRSPPIPGLRLIPYRAVGVADGLLLGMRLQAVRIGNRKGSMTVAFAPDDFCDSGEFQALTGGTL